MSTRTRVIVEAEYKKSPVGIYQGNPLIEALPRLMSSEDVFARLSVTPPKPDARSRKLPPHIRIHELLTLRMLVRPFSDYVAFEPSFSMMLRGGYISRHPTPEQWAKVYRYAAQAHHLPVEHPVYTNSAYGLLLYGLSGLGKSTLVNRILAGYPHAILHKNFDGPGSKWTQIVYVKVNSPSNGSVVALGKAIIQEIARIVGDPGLAVFRQRASPDDLLRDIAALSLTYCIGVIVIDEMQHLNEANPGHKKLILGFLTNLIEVVGVPVLGVGTYSIEPLFKEAFKTARKSAGLGSLEFYRATSPDDAQWKDLVEFVWEYQWLAKKQVLDPEIRRELFVQAVGIPDVLVKLLLLSQLVAITSKTEKITVESLRDVANRELRFLQPALNILRKAALSRLSTADAMRFDDLFPKGEWFDKALEKAMRQGLGARESEEDDAPDSPQEEKKRPPKGGTRGGEKATPAGVFYDFRAAIKAGASALESLRSENLVVSVCGDVD